MTAQLYCPDDWDDMVAAVHQWLAAEMLDLGFPAIFGETNAPAPPKPYVWLQLITPPVPAGQGDRGIAVPGEALEIKAVVPAFDYTVTVDGTACTYTSGPDDVLQDIREGLATAIEDATPWGVTEVHELPRVLNIETGAVETEVTVGANLARRRLESTERDGVAMFQVDVIGRDRDVTGATPPSSRWESTSIATRLVNSLETTAVLELLRVGGWAVVDLSSIRKGDIVAGSRWEDRSGFDVRLRCRLRALKVLDWIESAGEIAGTLVP